MGIGAIISAQIVNKINLRYTVQPIFWPFSVSWLG